MKTRTPTPSKAFEEFDDQKRWHGWRFLERNGEKTKIPISQNGNAKSNDASTWMVRREAEALVKSKNLEGLGIQLGLLPAAKFALIGVDLDSCLTDDGALSPWAAEIVDALKSYAEVSPSGTGLKIFAKVAARDYPKIREVLSGDGKSWKFASGKHPAAAEFFVGKRYFAVTLKHWHGSPNHVRSVNPKSFAAATKIAENEKQKISCARPSPPVKVSKAKASIGTNGANGDVKCSREAFDLLYAWSKGTSHAQKQARSLLETGTFPGQNDISRSGFEFQLACFSKKAGLTEEQFRAAATTAAEKGLGYGSDGRDTRPASRRERDWKRCWDRSISGTAVPNTTIAQSPWDTPNLSYFEDAFPPPAFPAHLFGEWDSWIEETAQSASAPSDYVAISLLTVSAAMVGNSLNILPEPKNSGWKERFALWGAIVGPPSSGKTPALAPFEAALSDIERDAYEAYIQEKEAEEKRNADRKQEKTRSAKEDVAREGEGGGILKAPEQPQFSNVTKPERLRIMDATIEKVASILQESPNGLLQWRDELAAWLEGHKRYNSASDRPNWLEMYSGGRLMIDRQKLDESINVPSALVSVLGGIQPGRLDEILDTPDDGLVARFLYVHPYPRPLERAEKGADTKKLKTALARLLELRKRAKIDGRRKALEFPFSSEAADLFFEFREYSRKEAADADGILASWIGKAAGVVARIAAILSLLDWAKGARWECPPKQVDKIYVERACELWADYLLPMAIRTLGRGERPEERLARRIIHRARTLRTQMINRREMRRDWNMPEIGRNPELTDKALKTLETDGLIRKRPSREGGSIGRQREDWEVNPMIFE